MCLRSKSCTPYNSGYEILTEEAFVYLILEKLLTKNDCKRLAIHGGIYHRSRWWWKQKYSTHMKEREIRLKSNMMRGNTRGQKEAPCIVIDRDKLQLAVSQGRAIESMAHMFGTTPFLVKENLRRQGMIQETTSPHWIDSFLEISSELEKVHPGITKLGLNYVIDPKSFFVAMYDAYLNYLSMADKIEDLTKAKWRFWSLRNNPNKGPLCFSRNKYERKLSAELLHSGIDHIRQFNFYGRYVSDFFITGTNLLVELEGDYHTDDPKTVERDIIRKRCALQAGYHMMCYSIKHSPRDIVRDVLCKLNRLPK